MDQSRVLLQTRSKNWAGRYRGLLELPQGHLDAHESLLECAARELREETGLAAFAPLARTAPSTERSHGEQLTSVESLVVSEVGDQAYMAVCIVGTACGTPRGSAESSSPHWCSRETVKGLLAEARVFPLNVPMLRWYLDL